MEDYNNIDELFDSLKGEFDIETPKEDHHVRFLDKLNGDSVKKSSGFNWKPFLSIAASLLIGLSLFIGLNNNDEETGLASVSPEYAEAQDFFTISLESELKKLNDERSPFTEKIINDALIEISDLETEYNQLKTDLEESGNDQRVIRAMIENFESRILILNDVLDNIEKIKQLNISSDETKNTI